MPLNHRPFLMSRRHMLQGTTALMAAAALPVRAFGQNAHASERVEALIARMTLEEKIGQLTLYPDEIRPTPRPINPDINAQVAARKRTAFQKDEIRRGRVGALLGGTGVALGREMQALALSSRMGIPLLFGADVVHGLRTIFPIPLGLAASFDPSLAQLTAQAAAEEMTAVGVHWTYAPMVDVARDQRWGRVAEGSGEDPYLGSAFAAAYVRGFQGEDLRSGHSVASCPKHFAGYGAPLGGMDYNSTDISGRELRQTHLPPFQAAFDAGAITVMSAFNDIDGVPASGSHELLTNILRGEMGFNGFVVSDAGSVEELIPHGFAGDEAEAAALGLNGGVDMNMGGGLYKRQLPGLLANGQVTAGRLDEAVRRILTVKEKLGLFDDPYRSLDPKREKSDIRKPTALALARESAAKSVVLLKNEGGLLPLADNIRVALIGPLGDDAAHMDGCWAPWAKAGEAVTLAAGLKAQIGDRLKVVKGAQINAPVAGGIEAAVSAAKKADIVLMAIGEGQDMSGEAKSRVEISIPPAQQQLAEAVAATGKPIVVILSCGRALALKGAVRDAAAILVGWFLGSEGGNALADIVTGRVSPSGRLPVSFPHETGQQPYYYNHRSTGRPQQPGEPPMFKARYIETGNEALYPFGHGMTYSTVSYEAPTVDQATLGMGEMLRVSAKLKNIGSRPVEEVAQLYIRDVVASITQPVRRLAGVQKLLLAPGEAKQVSFTLTAKVLSFIGQDLRPRTEPGTFLAWISPSSASGTSIRFDLIE